MRLNKKLYVDKTQIISKTIKVKFVFTLVTHSTEIRNQNNVFIV